MVIRSLSHEVPKELVDVQVQELHDAAEQALGASVLNEEACLGEVTRFEEEEVPLLEDDVLLAAVAQIQLVIAHQVYLLLAELLLAFEAVKVMLENALAIRLDLHVLAVLDRHRVLRPQVV